jgi:hypothetical protein
MWDAKFHTHTKQQAKLYPVKLNLYIGGKNVGRQNVLHRMTETIP